MPERDQHRRLVHRQPASCAARLDLRRDQVARAERGRGGTRLSAAVHEHRHALQRHRADVVSREGAQPDSRFTGQRDLKPSGRTWLQLRRSAERVFLARGVLKHGVAQRPFKSAERVLPPQSGRAGGIRHADRGGVDAPADSVDWIGECRGPIGRDIVGLGQSEWTGHDLPLRLRHVDKLWLAGPGRA